MKVEPEFKVENVVATAALKHRIDLNAVVKAFPEAEYRPEQFPGVIFRLSKPKTANLIFGSGKMVCTGARSEREAGKALRRVVRTLKTGGIVITGNLDVNVVNIVASGYLGGAVDLMELYEASYGMGGRIIYEPDQFPGLIYRMNTPKTVFLIFSSGKVVSTGARKEEDIHKAVKKLQEELDENELIRYE